MVDNGYSQPAGNGSRELPPTCQSPVLLHHATSRRYRPRGKLGPLPLLLLPFLLAVATVQARAQADNSLSPLQARSAIAIAALADPSGASLQAVSVAVSRLRTTKSAKERLAIIADVGDLLRKVADAKGPSEILAIAGTDQGRRHHLSFGLRTWDVHLLAYRGGERDQVMFPLLDDATVGSDPVARAPAEYLLSEKLLPLSAQELGSLFSAVVGIQITAGIQAVARELSPEHAAKAVEQTIRGFATAQSNQVNEILSTQINALRDGISTRRGAIERRIGKAQQDANLIHDSFRELRKARSLGAASGALEALASVTGNSRLAADIAKARRTIQAGENIYRGIQLMASATTGLGTYAAAMSILGASGSLGDSGGSSQAALLEEVRQLTALVREEFAKLNERVDRIFVALDDIATDIAEIKHISQATAESAAKTYDLVVGLYGRFGELERAVREEVRSAFAQQCYPLVILSTAQRPSDNELNVCLGAFAGLVRLPEVTFDSPSGDALEATLIQTLGPGSTFDSAQAWKGAIELAALLRSLEADPKLDELLQRDSSSLRSLHLVLGGANGYMALWRRWAPKEWVRPSTRSEYATVFGLHGWPDKLEASARFIAAIGGPKDRKLQKLSLLVNNYDQALRNVSSELNVQRELAAAEYLRINPARERALEVRVAPECGKQPPEAPRLKDSAWIEKNLGRGFHLLRRVHGLPRADRFADVGRRGWYDGLAWCYRMIGEGRKVEKIDTRLRQPDRRIYWSVSIEATFGGRPVVKLEAPRLHVGDFYRDVERYGHSMGQELEALDVLAADRLAEYSNTPEGQKAFSAAGAKSMLADERDLVQLASWALLEVDGNSNARKADISRDLRRLDAAAASVRGYVSLAGEALLTGNDRLRALVDGGRGARIADSHVVRTAIACAKESAPLDEREASRLLNVLRVLQPTDADRLCWRLLYGRQVPLQSFTATSPTSLNSLEKLFGDRATELRSTASNAKWEEASVGNYSIGSTTSQRVREFLSGD